MNQSQCEAMKKLFRTAYYVAKEDMALIKFKGLCELQVANGIELAAEKTYKNEHACRNFIQAAAETQFQDLIDCVRDSRFISVLWCTWKMLQAVKVEILVGRDKGKIGIVNSVIKERNWCFVDGLNCKYEWANKTATSVGQVMKKEKPLLVTTEVALVDPSDNKSTTAEWRYTDTGEKVRVSTRTGRIIPFSKLAEDTGEDFINRKKYVENEAKDTTEKQLKKITFEPKLCTFEQDIMDRLGIKEDRKPAPTFWY